MNCMIKQFLMGSTQRKRLSPSHYGEMGIEEGNKGAHRTKWSNRICNY